MLLVLPVIDHELYSQKHLKDSPKEHRLTKEEKRTKEEKNGLKRKKLRLKQHVQE